MDPWKFPRSHCFGPSASLYKEKTMQNFKCGMRLEEPPKLETLIKQNQKTLRPAK